MRTAAGPTGAARRLRRASPGECTCPASPATTRAPVAARTRSTRGPRWSSRRPGPRRRAGRRRRRARARPPAGRAGHRTRHPRAGRRRDPAEDLAHGGRARRPRPARRARRARRRWGDVLAAAAPFGLAPLSGSSPSVGVTGYTLGGGLGWLRAAHGFAADSLLRAEVVTADGSIVTASADDHADLFWALRGAAEASASSPRWSCACIRWPRSTPAPPASPSIARPRRSMRYREWIADAPDALSTACC